jgi:uncharacterized protein
MSRAALVVLVASFAALAASSVRAMPADINAPKPSFDCTNVKTESAENYICASPLLSQLDAEMAKLYDLASAQNAKAAGDVRRSQRAWIGKRDACAGRANVNTCLRDAYATRIEAIRQASPEARAAAGMVYGPFAFRCEGMTGDVTAMFVNTTPTGILRLDWGKTAKVLEQAMSADGSRYTGSDGTSFWSKGRGATFAPMRGKAEIQCTQQPDT